MSEQIESVKRENEALSKAIEAKKRDADEASEETRSGKELHSVLDRLDSAVTIHQDMINEASSRLKQFCEKTRALGEDVEKKEERAAKEAEILKS